MYIICCIIRMCHKIYFLLLMGFQAHEGDITDIKSKYPNTQNKM